MGKKLILFAGCTPARQPAIVDARSIWRRLNVVLDWYVHMWRGGHHEDERQVVAPLDVRQH